MLFTSWRAGLSTGYFSRCTPQTRQHCVVSLLVALGALASASASAQTLPPGVEALLTRAKVPREALAAVVVDAMPASNGKIALPLLNWRANSPMNPASVMKLVTTYAGLELLGPAYTWRTPVYLDGVVDNGVLRGNLIIQGKGDPKLVMERLWLLLRRVQGLGIKTITGDIVLDRRAFSISTQNQNPGDFDGEALRPYNVIPDALLVNYKAVVMTFVPNPSNGQASISYDPPLANVHMQPSVPLARAASGAEAACGDYRAQLKADLTDPFRMAFKGSYPAACGEKTWSVAYPDPASYTARAMAGLWQEMGGKLVGRVREGVVTPGLKPIFEMESPPLAEVIRDINKYSNNLMAQQLFLTFSQQRPGGSSNEASREILRNWWLTRFGPQEPAPILDNGSGLSRLERVTPQALARLLQTAYVSGAMPELMASLPISGVDGTLKRSKSQVSQGWAHLKSGTLRDATALAGYVHAPNGRRLVVVAIINHPNAPAARPALDALVDWAVQQAGL